MRSLPVAARYSNESTAKRSTPRTLGTSIHDHARADELAHGLLPLLDLAAAIDDERNVLTVFRRLDGDTFGRGFDVPDLRIARGFKFGYKLLLGQGMGRREDAKYHQTPKDHLKDWSRRHDPSSWLSELRHHTPAPTALRDNGSAVCEAALSRADYLVANARRHGESQLARAGSSIRCTKASRATQNRRFRAGCQTNR